MAITSAVVAVIGLGIQYNAAQDAKAASNRQSQALEGSAAAQRKQFEAEQRIADIKNARERANMARQARVARANSVSTGATTGTSTSSGVLGAVSSIGSQASANTGFFGAVGANQNDILDSQRAQGGFALEAGLAQGEITRANADANTGGAIFSLGSKVFDASGGFKSIFDKRT